MGAQAFTPANAINLGTALDIVSTFLDYVARSESPLADTPEYVAARCVLERLLGTGKPV